MLTERQQNATMKSSPRARTRKAHVFVTLSHWSMVVLLALSLLSGMRLGWGYLESPLGGPHGWWSTLLNRLAPTGTLAGVNVITLHITLAFLLLLITLIYVGYLICSKASRRLRLRRHDVTGALMGLYAGGFWRNKRALWSANLLVYWIAFALLFVLGITGVALYQPQWGLFTALGGYDTVRLAHGLATYLFLPYIVIHVILQWAFGSFWAIFKAQFYRPHLRAGLIGVALALPVAGALYAWDGNPTTLMAPRLDGSTPAPRLDGAPHDPAWSRAQAVTIRTVKGINNPDDHVDVAIKAVHDGERIYVQLEWADPDVSAKRFPLLKTAKGWKVLQTAMETANEDVFYEDKMALYITDVPGRGCAETCHLGVGPNGVQKGVHFTEGEVGDVWHWKSVRTGPMHADAGEPGYMDDQHFRAPDPLPQQPTKRYKAGYHADPKSGGGYRANFVKLEPDKPLSETYVRPLMLPPTHEIQPNPDPATSEHGVTWWIHEEQGIPYREDADTYPVGTLIPNTLITPLQGDRADVRAQGGWRQGTWTLEVSRALDTGSPYDVAITPAEPVYLSVATFNRTQTRHSEHLKPLRLVLQR